MKIYKGDSVLIIAGKDKGKKGTVLKVLLDKNRLVVAGINMRTKHVRKTPQSAGQRLHFEASIHASNVMLLDAKGKPTRVGMKLDEKGKKMRFAKTTGAVLGRSAVPKTEVVKKDVKEAKDSKEAKEKKSTSTTKETSSKVSSSSKKSPFWKKVGFGSDAIPHSEDPTSHDAPGADSAPKQGPTQSQSRAGSRGS